MGEKEDGKNEVTRNFKMDVLCTICSTPFNADTEGFDGDLKHVPVKLCKKCYTGLEAVVTASQPDVIIDCPYCDEAIGLKVEVIHDT
jgi:hypothetical protein